MTCPVCKAKNTGFFWWFANAIPNDPWQVQLDLFTITCKNCGAALNVGPKAKKLAWSIVIFFTVTPSLLMCAKAIFHLSIGSMFWQSLLIMVVLLYLVYLKSDYVVAR